MKLARSSLPVLDARALGAKCDACPLNDRIPIPPSPNLRAQLILCGEAPGKTEELEGRYFCGESGRLKDKLVEALNIPAGKLHITNALMCRPDRNLSPAEWKQALDCCRPRLNRELEGVKARTILALGKRALQTLANKASIFDWMGAPLLTEEKSAPRTAKNRKTVREPKTEFPGGYHVLPTLHPAFVLRMPEWLPVLRIHFERAWALATGALKPWVWPEIAIEGPSLMRALEQIADEKLHVGLDVETGGRDPFSSPLLNTGLASVNIAASAQWFNCGDKAQKLAKQIIADPGIPKECHNGSYDVLTLESNGIAVRGYDFDTLTAHALVAPRLRHGLGIVCGIEFHAPRWKSEFRHGGDDAGSNRFITADPAERAIYNAKDSYMTALLRERLSARLERVHNGWEQFEQFSELGALAISMSRRGMPTDRGQFAFHRKQLMRRRAEAKRELLNVCESVNALMLPNSKGEPKPFNLHSSSQHTATLFVEKFRIKPRSFSEKTGRPRFDENVLGDLCAHPDQRVSDAARLVLQWRKFDKLLIYVNRLEAVDIIHPFWNPNGAKTGRWSCSDGLQTIPKSKPWSVVDWKRRKRKLRLPTLRSLYRAAMGMQLVEADYKQVEAFILALLTGDEKLLEMLQSDIHTTTAQILFGYSAAAWDALPEKEQKYLRDLAKRARYAMHYGAKPETSWHDLVPDFPSLTLTDVVRLFRSLATLHPKIVAWHRAQLEGARINDFVEAPISGRRYYFHGLVEPNKCYNLPIQMTAADIINAAALRLWKRLDESRIGFILLQIHDALVCEGPDPIALGALMREEMERPVRLGELEVVFRVDLSAGTNWGELKKMEA